ncbi:hypothetical protein HDU93_004266 [Gonapodya sp. JEL0774]|nr:hypothetical protein HDU93_004266 [Gonapodya sp. JEL0774]
MASQTETQTQVPPSPPTMSSQQGSDVPIGAVAGAAAAGAVVLVVIATLVIARARNSKRDRRGVIPVRAVTLPAHWFYLSLQNSMAVDSASENWTGVEADTSIRCDDETPFLVETRFEPTSNDEIALVPGTFVIIQRVFRDGWGVCESLDTGEVGIAPL